ncbi:MAG: prephenate dehydrogenase [Actinomyces urogenitalis]|uniref:Prephenate dehydrogenase n=3 Tax=Actinomyces urogenitalis TaxID=103621 RepID=C0W3E9_9ACTO|nr:prephenate dehydrogenase [Actinomyces urogenitalis]EEH66712.1 prephenate dehydrogenase [Actinomyces urogenitalis DSM 15434]MBS5976163.1 prephenate dehydrogenase [Actinomyces urogenitalis]MDK8236595.1 prephenate dehydrogenase [Actinomyces urogenitalis]MDU0971444.1 prephenate dehydrogenase [Actinomyces urogenitalis]MDU6151016.1 prephenate dehydrogenase [Actinomyces urogenitalis]
MSSAPTTPPTNPHGTVATQGPVLVVGTGLLGTSLALALSASGVAVQLSDTSPTSLALARDMGAGRVRSDGDEAPQLVVVATPPDVAASVVLAQLSAFPEAVVTDVASVKQRVVAEVRAHAGQEVRRYVGSHPMAGRERSGAGAADCDLFVGRPWVIVPDGATPQAELVVRNLAVDVGATPLRMAAAEHDEAVAAVSHVPQLVSSLLAARLEELPESALALAGQGLRDTTRIAASDPRLWSAILVGNAGPVVGLLRALREDLDTLIGGIAPAAVDPASPDYTAAGRAQTIAPGAVGAITDVMGRGNTGQARIPGKHGGAPRRYAEVQVLVPDTAGSLGRLFSDVGAAGVNIEDFAMEHSAGQSAGIAMLSVSPAAAQPLEETLEEGGWRVVRL